MNSVALPASASTSVLGAEADLVRQAARGDTNAFGELFRRHSAPAWRLAQAVTADRDAAVAAFKDGFVRSLREGRRPRRAAAPFRPQVLAAVYRAAIDQTFDRSGRPATARRSPAEGPDAALADAAFRSLPERWRAAVWLSEVENFETERIAAVLSVSATVAEQLIARGKRGLAGRYAQARHEVPEHVGEVLRAVALAMPTNLSDVASARWSASGADPMPILAPITGWLEDRAARPMSVVVGALLGLGLVGLGVVGNTPSVRSQLGAAGAANLNGSVPVTTCLGLACPAGTGPTSSPSGSQAFFGGGGFLTSGLSAPGGAGATTGAGSGLAGTSGTSGTSGNGGGTSTGPGFGGSGAPGGSGGSGGGGTGGGTTLGVPGIATVTLSGSGVALNVLNGTVACSTTGGTCASPVLPAQSKTSNPVTSTAQNVTSTVQSTTSGAAGTVANTVAPATSTATNTVTGTVSNPSKTLSTLGSSLSKGL